jgi:hypothetical protein
MISVQEIECGPLSVLPITTGIKMKVDPANRSGAWNRLHDRRVEARSMPAEIPKQITFATIAIADRSAPKIFPSPVLSRESVAYIVDKARESTPDFANLKLAT